MIGSKCHQLSKDHLALIHIWGFAQETEKRNSYRCSNKIFSNVNIKGFKELMLQTTQR